MPGLVLNLLAVMPAGAQETEPPPTPVTITRIGISIEGKTHPNILLRELRIEEGKVFESYEYLEDVLNTRAEALESRRLFKEFTWNLESTAADTAEIDIHIVDSFTLYPRPMFKYSSDTGILLGLKLEYFNAFGTLTDQTIEAYWSPAEIKFSLDVDKVIIGPIHMDYGFEQYFGSTRYGAPDDSFYTEYKSMYSLIDILFNFQLGAASNWAYYLEPRFKWQYSYTWETHHPTIPDEEFVDNGFAVGFNHGFYSDQVDWIGNFRKGMEFSIMNDNLWYTQTGRQDLFLENDIYAYLPLAPWVEISGRIGGFYAFSGVRADAGDRLRGVVDYNIFGEWGAYLNFQTSFRVLPSYGFVEIQLRPFVDVGYVISDQWGYGPDAWEYCAGSTLIFYLDALPSLIMNLEFGWDFKRNNPEIIFDTSLLL